MNPSLVIAEAALKLAAKELVQNNFSILGCYFACGKTL